MERLFYIDFLRFLAIFFITGAHVARFIKIENIDGFGILFKNIFITGGWLGCCLFFCISGYCLCLKYNEKENYFKYLIKRLIKILPAYYFAIFVWYILVKMGSNAHPIGISAILSHVFLVHNLHDSNFYSISGLFWFMGVLFDFYVIFPLLYKLKNIKFGLETVTIVLFVLSFLISRYFDVHSDVFNKSILIQLPCFSAGILMFNRKLPKLFSNSAIVWFIILTTTILTFLTNVKGVWDTPIYLLSIIESILIFFSIILIKDSIETTPNFIKKFISIVGISSYSIYLYNYIYYATTPLYKNSIMCFMYILFVFGFGICMYYIVENPLNIVSKKLTNLIQQK